MLDKLFWALFSGTHTIETVLKLFCVELLKTVKHLELDSNRLFSTYISVKNYICGHQMTSLV